MRYPTTVKTLIDKLRDGDSVSWGEFYERYHQIIRDVGAVKGLSGDECSDLVQELMLRFFRNSSTFRFDPNIAKFRTYFSRIVSGKIVDILRRRMVTKPEFAADEELCRGVEEPPDVALDRILLDRWRRFMLEQAREILRSRVDAGTYQAFELYAEQGRELRRVAEALEMTPNRIYVAKSRCLKMLRQILLELNESDPELELLRDEV